MIDYKKLQKDLSEKIKSMTDEELINKLIECGLEVTKEEIKELETKGIKIYGQK